jgi:hypothetical protein
LNDYKQLFNFNIGFKQVPENYELGLFDNNINWNYHSKDSIDMIDIVHDNKRNLEIEYICSIEWINYLIFFGIFVGELWGEKYHLIDRIDKSITAEDFKPINTFFTEWEIIDINDLKNLDINSTNYISLKIKFSYQLHLYINENFIHSY